MGSEEIREKVQKKGRGKKVKAAVLIFNSLGLGPGHYPTGFAEREGSLYGQARCSEDPSVKTLIPKAGKNCQPRNLSGAKCPN